ncbi:MAG: bifunctional DNA-formamidopyrimidine glycosylase/DNA-(apurinic or apyrimidinic site) lyase [Patescibacteria group bacterium]
MPELPEVETIRRVLDKQIRGQIISRVEIRNKRIVKSSVAIVQKALTRAKIVKIKRRGKLLIFNLDNEKILLIHLKMTGQLVWQAVNKKIKVGGHPIIGVVGVPNKFTRVVLYFKNKGRLFFNDVRKFGYWQVIDQKDLEKIESRFGPEPLTRVFNKHYLFQVIKNRKRSKIKSVLLDQKVVAGLGNIYIDESLWQAKVKPSRLVGGLSLNNIRLICSAIKLVIKQAIKFRGTSFNSYIDPRGKEGSYWQQRKVYSRQGLACKRCGDIIIKIKQAGRGTHYCPTCQK